MTVNRGRNLIKASAIILTILGVIGILSNLLATPFNHFMYGIFNPAQVVVAIIDSGAMLVFGIFGIKFADDAQKGQTISTMGIVLLVTHFAGVAVSIYYAMSINETLWYDETWYDIGVNAEFLANLAMSIMIGAIIFGAILFSVPPILYIIGGNMNKKNAEIQ